MVEKNTTQSVEGETSQTDEGKAQPTVEELQREVEEKDKEIERKEGVLQQTKRELRDARGRGSKVEIEALGKRLETQEEILARALDDITSRVAGDYDEPKPTRKSYTQELQERREKSKPEEPKLDPDAQRFLTYCDVMDLRIRDDIEDCDPIVQEALKGRDIKDALEYLKGKMKPKEADVEKLAEEKAKLIAEEKMKEFTTGGPQSPSGSSGRNFTRKQIKDMSMEEYKEKKPEIDEAMRQGKVK